MSTPEPPLPAMPPKRPAGVTLLAFLAMLIGVFRLAIAPFAIMGNMLRAPFTDLFASGSAEALSQGGPFLGGGWLLSGILWLAAGYGLYRLKGWAWLVAIAAAALSLALALYGILQNGIGLFFFCFGVWDLLIPIVVLVYLYRATVRKAFGRA